MTPCLIIVVLDTTIFYVSPIKEDARVRREHDEMGLNVCQK